MLFPKNSMIALGLLVSIIQTGLSLSQGASIASYDIDVKIPPQADRIEVSAGCTMIIGDSTSLPAVLLNSGVRELSIRVDGGGPDIPFEIGVRDTVRLHLTAPMRRETALSVRFHYLFPIEPLGDSLLLLSKGSHWYPITPNQLATLKLRCEVPETYNVLSAGDLVETSNGNGTSVFVWESKRPIFKIPMVVFKRSSLHKNVVHAQRKELVLWSTIADSLETRAILGEAWKVFTCCTKMIGGYPFDGMTLVEVPYFEGIDISSGLVMIGSPSLQAMEKGDFEALHLSVAEQWIGAGVFAEFGKPGFWFLTISLPHYLRLMCVQQMKGDEAFGKELHAPLKQYEKFAGKENDVPILDIDFPNTKEKGLLLYGKGPLVIHKVHMALGDDAWRALLTDTYKAFAGKILTYTEFQSCLAKHDKKGTALPLLNSLMTRKGMPAE